MEISSHMWEALLVQRHGEVLIQLTLHPEHIP
jgi:hypothetical protein